MPAGTQHSRCACVSLLSMTGHARQALERRDVHGSVVCLRKQLAKSRAKPDRLHRLAACILCATPEELRHAADWPGAGPASRQRVVEELQASALRRGNARHSPDFVATTHDARAGAEPVRAWNTFLVTSCDHYPVGLCPRRHRASRSH